ncbi:cytochrome P450 [Lojkania enalia]|uniref:Cytochrome P450 n=1 Tax=Lojkania enalia TaxID=147567 RepID=A0A9P4KI45_9PLEO|nr:cytochrome P450 [Didymosphaeria enalia]
MTAQQRTRIYLRIHAASHEALTAAKLAMWNGPIPSISDELYISLTDWYSVCHLVNGDRHIDFYYLHEKYDIYSMNANVKRSQVYASTAHFFGGTPSSNTTPDIKEHTFRRKVNVRALNPVNIKSMKEQILKNVRYFRENLVDGNRDDWSPPHDMSHQLMLPDTRHDMDKPVGYLISDVMGNITFSKSFELQKKPDNRDILTSLPQAVAGIHLVTCLRSSHSDSIKILFRNLIAGISRFTGLSASTFQWRFAQENCNNFFFALLQARDDKTGQGFSTDQLVSEAGLLTIARSDITVTATTAIFFYLSHYPSFSSVEDIRIGAQLASCQYLLACIEESLRLSPPVDSTLMREVLPGGLTVDGEWYPPGTDIAVPHYALHHDERYVAKPFVFKPQRWISKDSSVAIDVGLSLEATEERQNWDSSSLESIATSAFTAFGVGRTSCFGKYLAYQESSLVVAQTIWLFDMRTEPESTLGEGSEKLGARRERPKEFQTWDRFVSMHDGPMLQFKRRKI